jgi:hypothetical protein
MMGMGGMGGMMGGMGGMMGGMGGGFRSIPPTGLPETTLKPHQTRHLPTTLVGLNAPDETGRGLAPEKGEKLVIGEVGQVTKDPLAQAALKRLAQVKAPQTVSQLVMWKVAGGLDWDTIARLTRGRVNAHEIALARRLVDQLGETEGKLPPTEAGMIYWELKTAGSGSPQLSAQFRKLLDKYTMLGLKAKEGVPASPDGPALACKADLSDSKVSASVLSTDGAGAAWVTVGKFTLKNGIAAPTGDEKKDELSAARLADSIAEGIISRLVNVRISNGPRMKGKPTYKVRITNSSPLILNGVALAGAEISPNNPPTALAGLTLPPRKSLTVPATAELVSRLHLKESVRVVALDLSGL